MIKLNVVWINTNQVKVNNKRLMGHIAQPKKVPINKHICASYHYTITLNKRKKVITFFFWRITRSLFVKNLSPLQPGILCAKFG